MYNQGMVPQRAPDLPSVPSRPVHTHGRRALHESENLDPSTARREESAARERSVMYNRDMVPQQASDLPVPNGSQRSLQLPSLRTHLREFFTPESAAVQPPLNAYYGDDVVMYDRDTVPQRASDLPSVPPSPARAPGADPARRFACELCDERFDRPHLRSILHADQKPHACSHPGCSKTFTVKSSLRRHERIHDDAVSAFEGSPEERPSYSGHYSNTSKPPKPPSSTTYYSSCQ
ncbi:hypothetical protein JB92DRAFT_3117652 [Gautieria morchelliformis]|nr:hypothetical protein JB92DRAFT_3117652 [Gautieria morchelliformis]